MHVVGEPVPLSGTAGSTFVWVNVVNARGKPSFARKMTIQGLDGTNDLQLSFDGGKTYSTHVHGTDSVDVEATFNRFAVKASAGTVAWSALLTVA